MEENEKVMNRGGEPADGTPLLLGHEGVAVDRLVYFGGIVPGDHART